MMMNWQEILTLIILLAAIFWLFKKYITPKIRKRRNSEPACSSCTTATDCGGCIIVELQKEVEERNRQKASEGNKNDSSSIKSLS